MQKNSRCGVPWEQDSDHYILLIILASVRRRHSVQDSSDGVPVSLQDHSKWAVTLQPPPPPHATADAEGATMRKLLSGEAGPERHSSDDGGYPRSVCIGDINRERHQLQRGGGTVCFVANDALWESFYGIVEEFDECHALS